MNNIKLFLSLAVNFVINSVCFPCQWKNFLVSAQIDWAWRGMEDAYCDVCGEYGLCIVSHGTNGTRYTTCPDSQSCGERTYGMDSMYGDMLDSLDG